MTRTFQRCALLGAVILLALAACDRSRPAAVAGTDSSLSEEPALEVSPVVPDAEERPAVTWGETTSQIAEAVSGGLVSGRFVGTGVQLSAGPLVGDGLVIVGQSDGEVVARDAGTGEVYWRIRLASPVRALAPAGSSLAVAAGDAVTLVDAASGQTIWTTAIDGLTVTASFAVGASRVYAGVNGAGLVALDRETGDERWRARLPGDAIGRLLLFDGQVIGVTGTGTLFAVDAGNGDGVWRVSLDGTFVSGPRLSRPGQTRELAVVSVDGTVSIVVADGSQVRSYESGLEVVLAPPSWTSGRLVVAGADGTIRALDRDGEPSWRADLAAHAAGEPVTFDNVVLIFDSQGGVYSIDAASGERLASTSVPDMVEGRPVYSNGAVFVRTRTGMLGSVSVNAASERPPLLDDSRSHVLPARGTFRLQDERVRLSLGTQRDAVFDITIATSPREELVLTVVDQDGDTVATNMGKVALSRTIRAALSASRSYELVIERPDPQGEITISIQTEQIQ